MDMASRPNSHASGTMASSNETGFQPSSLILIGIPGMEDFHIWLAAPLSAIYIVILFGNCALLLAIKTIVRHYKPMYSFICQLAVSDLGLSSSVMPKMLSILWFNDGEIKLSACFTQMFLVVSFLSLESSILLAMAFDRYTAVCDPLRYFIILTNSLIAKIAAASVTRALVLATPLLLLYLRLPFCGRNVAHLFCQNMAVAKLVCADTTVNNIYAFVIALLVVPLDFVCIVISYIQILQSVLQLSLKEERFKAFRTCASHIFIMSTFYGPLLSSMILNRLHHNVPQAAHVIIGAACLFLSPLMNPFIYGVTLKEVRQGMYQVNQLVHFKLWKCLCERDYHQCMR